MLPSRPGYAPNAETSTGMPVRSMRATAAMYRPRSNAWLSATETLRWRTRIAGSMRQHDPPRRRRRRAARCARRGAAPGLSPPPLPPPSLFTYSRPGDVAFAPRSRPSVAHEKARTKMLYFVRSALASRQAMCSARILFSTVRMAGGSRSGCCFRISSILPWPRLARWPASGVRAAGWRTARARSTYWSGDQVCPAAAEDAHIDLRPA